MTNTVTKRNAKKLTKYFRKNGLMARQVRVEKGCAPNAQPNACNINAISFAERNGDRYKVCFGYLVNEKAAIAHVWNFDTYNKKFVDITPSNYNTGIYKDMVYVEANEYLWALYTETDSMEKLNPCVFVPNGSIDWVDYDLAQKLDKLDIALNP